MKRVQHILTCMPNWRDSVCFSYYCSAQIKLSAIVILAPCSLVNEVCCWSWAFVVLSLRENAEQNWSNFSSSSKMGWFLSRCRFSCRHLEDNVGWQCSRGESTTIVCLSSWEDTIDIDFLSNSGPDDFERDRERFDANFRGKSNKPLSRDCERVFFSFFASSFSSSNLSAIRLG